MVRFLSIVCVRAHGFGVCAHDLYALDLDVCVHDSGMFVRVVELLSEKGKWQNALDLVERMKAEGLTPTQATYSCAADACAKGGNW